ESTTENTQEITTESNSFCPAHAEPDHAQIVLEHFNKVTNSSYRDGKTTMGHIRARLAENYTSDDLILVTDYITAKWMNDSKMSDYLRPKTLFSPENCMEYFEKAQKWHEAGRPVCANGKWLKPGEVAVSIDTVERDTVFTQIFSTGWKPANRIQEIAKEMASRSGLGRLNEFAGRSAWKGIWQQAAEQAAREVTA
ncbi:conserved phage C-terminal domain-containing protein, partial [Providencia alcalifaciens]